MSRFLQNRLFLPRAAAVDFLSCAAILVIAAALFASAPVAGEFWWSEAPRNALNGAFVLDLVREFPSKDPVEWAYDYYRRYPALTVLFYPPLLYVFIALFYAVFGVSHWSAMLCITAFYAVLALGIYALARRILPPMVALGTVLILAAAPEIAFWGRQVMLEIPAYAFLVWAGWFALRHADTGRPQPLYAALFLLLCALYVKQTVIFAVPAIAAAVLAARSWPALRDRHVWIASTLFAFGLLPLIGMQLRFGAFNVASVVERADVDISRGSLEAWTWYLTRLPETLGWPATALAFAFAAAGLVHRTWWPPRADTVFYVSWIAIGYAFLSLIHLKDTRFGVFLYLPLAMFAGLFLYRALPRAWSPLLALGVGAAMAIFVFAAHPAPRVNGYREAAAAIAETAAPGSLVMFVGKRDGSFIFNLRALGNHQDISVVRADKLFLDIAVMSELGVNARDYDESQIIDVLRRYGIGYAVYAEGHAYEDVPVMRRLVNVLQGDSFEQLRRIPVAANQPHHDLSLTVYRHKGPLADPPEPFDLRLRAAGITIPGSR